MDKLTADTMRAISSLDFVDKGFSPATPDLRLELEIARAVSWLEWATGLVTDDITVDTNDAIMWDQATQLLVEQRIIHRSDDYVTDAADDINDISVTGYAAKRIDPKLVIPRGRIVALKELDDLLWALMTDDKRSYWRGIIFRINDPASVVTYFDSVMDDQINQTDDTWHG